MPFSQAREERKREVEDHVNMVNKLLKDAGHVPAESDEDGEGSDEEEFEGFPDRPELDLVDDEEEYIDEDRYTTVTVETVDVSRDGLNKPLTCEEEEKAETEKRRKYEEAAAEEEAAKAKKGDFGPKKKKKKKFRYETKLERQLSDRKQKAKNIKKRA